MDKIRDKILDKVDSCDPYGRPARRTQWIASTLAYHYGLDRGVENEIIVLATGLDQYLQEIFHHMDCTGDGKIPMEDFNILCEILGLNKDSESEECVGVLDNLPSEFTFRQFHAKLCGYFSTKAGSQYENGRLLVGKDSEHIETQIRLRIPLRRRKKLLSLEAGRRESRGSSPNSDRHLPGCRQQRASCTRECYEEIVALEEAEERITKLQDENASLRELVEDMRAALQSSDARSLALQVGLLKSHSKHKSEGGCFIAHHKLSVRTTHSSNNCHGNTKTHNLSHIKTAHSSNPSSQHDPSQYSSLRTNSQYSSLRSLLHEIDPIHSSRDGQVEETILFNKKLEQELKSSREAVSALEGCNRALQVEQGDMRRKVEDARQALVSGMGKVKELEAKASRVPVLQRHIQQLEQEILYYRSEVSNLQLSGCTRANKQVGGACGPVPRCCLDNQQDRRSPTGRSETTPDNSQEQLFRSVEGQAASDDDEEKWTGEQQRQVDEVKRILTRLSCCGDRCDDKAMKKLLSHFSGSRRSEESRRGGEEEEEEEEERSEERRSAVVELLEKVTRLNKKLEQKETQAQQLQMDMGQMKDTLVQVLQQKAEEAELLQTELQMLETELQMLETERVCLSLVEEKLLDVLQLLHQLRDLNVSRSSLGKILLSTLESCSDPQHGKAHILEVLNALYHELAACEVLRTQSLSNPLERTQSLNNPLERTQSLNNPLERTQSLNNPLERTQSLSNPLERTQSLSNPLERTQSLNNPLERTQSLNNPLERTQSLNNPLERTQSLSNPLERTQSLSNPLERTQSLSNPLERTQSLSNPLERTQSLNNPLERTQSLSNPLERTQSLNNPLERTQSLNNPLERTQSLNNPLERTQSLNNPLERTQSLSNPLERTQSLNNPLERTQSLSNPLERTQSLNNPLERTQSFNNPLERTQSLSNPLERTQSFNNPLERTQSLSNPLERTQSFNNPLERTQSLSNPLERTQSLSNPLERTQSLSNPLERTQSLNNPLERTQSFNNHQERTQSLNNPL